MDQQTLLRKLNLSTFIAFDFETTGLDRETDRIIEIAAIRFVDGKPIDRYVTLVNPAIPISNIITDITGISNNMVKDAPKESAIVDEFLTFLGDSPLVAHNISFDISFLKALRERYGKPKVDHILYDTLQLSRTFLFDRAAFNLGSIVDYFQLPSGGAHRAEKDTENCGLIFIKLVEEAASYPLDVSSKVLALIKPVSIPNKSLYVNLANELTKQGDLKKGLSRSTIDHSQSYNIFICEGGKSIDSISVDDLFEKKGLLAQSMENYEDRPNQTNYSRFVEEVITGEPEIGVAEAGTGLGKSLAYLFPALKRALKAKEDGPTIISCYTKHLQDQLFYKDLPMLGKALDVPINAVTLKGRNNYICLTRLDWQITDAGKLLSPAEIESLMPIIIWLNRTHTGDLSECTGFWSSRPGRVVGLIQSEPGFCTTNLCSKHHGCYFGMVRRAIFDADILIINHALLLSEISGPGFLPPYKTVIIDESHNLVNTAYNQFTLHLDQNMMMAMIQNMDPSTPRNVRWNTYLAKLSGLYSDFSDYQKRLRDDAKLAFGAINTFFEILNYQCNSRYSPEDVYTKKYVVNILEEEFSAVQGEIHQLEKTLNQLSNTIARLGRELLNKDPGKEDYLELHQVFEQRLEEINDLRSLLANLTSNQISDWVYWQEGKFRRKRSGGEKLNLSLHSSPVDVSSILSDLFFKTIDHCVLTSATLRVNDSFDYFLNRIGLNKVDSRVVKSEEYDSPFYYKDQVNYLQYGGTFRINNHPHSLATVIYNCHKKHNKRIMALFTSHNTLNTTYRELRLKPEGRNLPIFAQVYGTSRYSMIRGMHRTPNGILLGTNAFWEGVDLPGELLEILIITKLPFDVPSEPIVRAYSTMIEKNGGNSFLDFSVPECVIKFRQGFGRLIRTISDQGIFIVTDDRLVTKSYGRHFSDAIPTRMQVFTDLDDLKY